MLFSYYSIRKLLPTGRRNAFYLGIMSTISTKDTPLAMAAVGSCLELYKVITKMKRCYHQHSYQTRTSHELTRTGRVNLAIKSGDSYFDSEACVTRSVNRESWYESVRVESDCDSSESDVAVKIRLDSPFSTAPSYFLPYIRELLLGCCDSASLFTSMILSQESYESAMVAKDGYDTTFHPFWIMKHGVITSDVSGGVKKGRIFGFASVSYHESFLAGTSSTITSREVMYERVREEMCGDMDAFEHFGIWL